MYHSVSTDTITNTNTTESTLEKENLVTDGTGHFFIIIGSLKPNLPPNIEYFQTLWFYFQAYKTLYPLEVEKHDFFFEFLKKLEKQSFGFGKKSFASDIEIGLWVSVSNPKPGFGRILISSEAFFHEPISYCCISLKN